ncbi:hypothetical protein D3C72_1797010 [compost metagenome]
MPQALKNQASSASARPSMPTGIRRLAARYTPHASGSPASVAMLIPATRRSPNGALGCAAGAVLVAVAVAAPLRLACVCDLALRLTDHSTMPVAIIRLPSTPKPNSAQRRPTSANRAMCRPYSTP